MLGRGNAMKAQTFPEWPALPAELGVRRGWMGSKRRMAEKAWENTSVIPPDGFLWNTVK